MFQQKCSNKNVPTKMFQKCSNKNVPTKMFQQKCSNKKLKIFPTKMFQQKFPTKMFQQKCSNKILVPTKGFTNKDVPTKISNKNVPTRIFPTKIFQQGFFNKDFDKNPCCQQKSFQQGLFKNFWKSLLKNPC